MCNRQDNAVYEDLIQMVTAIKPAGAYLHVLSFKTYSLRSAIVTMITNIPSSTGHSLLGGQSLTQVLGIG